MLMMTMHLCFQVANCDESVADSELEEDSFPPPPPLSQPSSMLQLAPLITEVSHFYYYYCYCYYYRWFIIVFFISLSFSDCVNRHKAEMYACVQ